MQYAETQVAVPSVQACWIRSLADSEWGHKIALNISYPRRSTSEQHRSAGGYQGRGHVSVIMCLARILYSDSNQIA